MTFVTMRLRLCRSIAPFGLAFALALPVAAQPAARPVVRAERATSAWSPDSSRPEHLSTRAALITQDRAQRLPRWMRWGLVGAATGAIAFPLLGSLASDSDSHLARDAAAGAVAGFVVIGGSVAIWDAVCSGDTRSRRAGLCGRR